MAAVRAGGKKVRINVWIAAVKRRQCVEEYAGVFSGADEFADNRVEMSWK